MYSNGVFERESFTDSPGPVLIEDAEFGDCVFTGVGLAGATLRSCRFLSCRFLRCDLAVVRIPDTRISGCTFEDCRTSGVDWTRGRWLRTDVHGPNSWIRSDVGAGTFAGLDLESSVFRECRARQVSFRDARLVAADFSGTDCTGADFLGADLSEARLVGATGVVIDPRVTTVAGLAVDGVAAHALLAALGVTVEDADR